MYMEELEDKIMKYDTEVKDLKIKYKSVYEEIYANSEKNVDLMDQPKRHVEEQIKQSLFKNHNIPKRSVSPVKINVSRLGMNEKEPFQPNYDRKRFVKSFKERAYVSNRDTPVKFRTQFVSKAENKSVGRRKAEPMLPRNSQPKRPTDSMLAYQIFYENLEESKQQSQLLAKSNKKYSTLRKPDKMVIGRNTLPQKPLFDNNEILIEDKINESNNSIKDLVFNEDLENAFNDNMSDDHLENNEILKNLEDDRFNYQRKEQAEFVEIEQPQQGIENILYMNLQQYPFYINPDNQILLKASSLFDNSILMSNSYVKVYCKTYKKQIGDILNVIIELTYKPEKHFLRLSTELVAPNKAISDPHTIEYQELKGPLQQTFSFTFDKNNILKDFPKLKVVLFEEKNMVENVIIPIPYSINKFTVNRSFGIDDIDYFLQYVS